MDIVELMQKALDKTNDHDAIFALDKGITEIERLREALEKVLSVQPIKGDEGSTDMIALAKALLEIDSIARDALKEKE